MSQEFSRTASRILGALNEFLLNPIVRAQSGTVPGCFQTSNTEKGQRNEDRSQNDLRTEVGTSIYRSPQSLNLDPDEAVYTKKHEANHPCQTLCITNQSEEKCTLEVTKNP